MNKPSSGSKRPKAPPAPAHLEEDVASMVEEDESDFVADLEALVDDANPALAAARAKAQRLLKRARHDDGEQA